jgi:hypothetical protein
MDANDRLLKAALDQLDTVQVPPRGVLFEGHLRAALAGADLGPIYAGLSRPAAHRSHGRLRRVILLAVAAAALCGAGLAAVMLLPARSGSPGSSALGPANASAAQVAAWMVKGLQAAHSIQGQLLVRSVRPHPLQTFDLLSIQRIDFVLTANGDFRTDDTVLKDTSLPHPPKRFLAVYDAAKHEYRQTSWRSDDRVTGYLWQGADPYDPRVLPASSEFHSFDIGQLQAYGALVRSALTTGKPPIHPIETTYLGRPSWKIVTKQGSALGASMTAIVDRASGLLLFYRSVTPEPNYGGSHQEVFELQMTSLQIDAAVDRHAFTLALPAVRSGSGPHSKGRIDRVVEQSGRSYVPLGAVAGDIGRAPLVAGGLPAGYRLDSVPTFAARALRGWQLAPGLVQVIPAPTTPHDSVSFTYRRGLERVIVEVLPSSLLGSSGAARLGGLGSEQVKLSSGALRGYVATLGFELRLWAPQWLAVSGRGFYVIIQGDLTRAELIAAADSLQVYAP